jgi:hypothetical protein
MTFIIIFLVLPDNRCAHPLACITGGRSAPAPSLTPSCSSTNGYQVNSSSFPNQEAMDPAFAMRFKKRTAATPKSLFHTRHQSGIYFTVQKRIKPGPDRVFLQ